MATCLYFLVFLAYVSSVLANDTTNLPECSVNEDCDQDRVCRVQKCVNPCATVCAAANTLCYVTNHTAVCACRTGYFGHPETGCSLTYIRECVTNTDCAPDRVCTEQKCVNPCSTVCWGANTMCYVTEHVVKCACRPGYSGHPDVPECVTNRDCDPDRVCTGRQCVNPCPTVCEAANSLCNVTNHVVTCACLPGYSGLPSTGCSLNVKPDSRKTEILNSDMSSEMDRYAVKCVAEAYEMYNIRNYMAKYISGQFDSKYGGYWQCIIRPTAAVSVTWGVPTNSRYYILLKYEEIQVLLFKAQEQTLLE